MEGITWYHSEGQQPKKIIENSTRLSKTDLELPREVSEEAGGLRHDLTGLEIKIQEF
jgi:hypothetical protein